MDGDGGYITTNFVPGLLDYVGQLNIPFHEVGVGNRRHTLVEFREAFHDAVELSHEYRFTGPSSLQVPAGLKALVSARRSVGLSKKTTIVVHGVDESRLRLLVEVVTELDTDTVPVANGLRCIREGYSYAATYNQAQIPQCYRQAEDDARSNCRGLWQLEEYHSVLQKEDFKPWTLKRHLRTSNEGRGYGQVGEEFTGEDDATTYAFVVKVSTEHLNEANLYVAQSTIENAGLGLFLLPPRPGAREKVIPACTSLCIYAHPIGPGETDESHGDYYVFCEGRSYDAKIIDGKNHGRFANQGGLDEGTKKMCELAALPAGVFNWREVNREVEQKINAVLKTVDRKKTLKLVTTRVITIPDDSVCREVFVDYDLKGYWVPYVLKNLDVIGHDHWMVKRTLWFLLSNKSSQASTTWATELLREHGIESLEEYADADCPVAPPQSRRTRSTRQ